MCFFSAALMHTRDTPKVALARDRKRGQLQFLGFLQNYGFCGAMYSYGL